MSRDGTQKVIDGYLDAIGSGGDFGSFYADDVRLTMLPAGQEITGREAVRDFISTAYTALDAQHGEGNKLIEDGRASIEIVMTGTQVGEFAGIPATGATFSLPYCVFYDVSDAKITALRVYLSIDAVVAQLTRAGSQDGQGDSNDLPAG